MVAQPERNTKETATKQASLPASAVQAASPAFAPAASFSHVPNSSKNPPAARSLRPFLIRWGIASGSILLILVVLGLLGLVWEPIALTAVVLSCTIGVGCLLAGTIWIGIAAGRENLLLGVVTTLAPAIGLGLVLARKIPGIRGGIVFLSALPAAGLALVLLAVYQPLYSPQSRGAASASRQARMADVVARAERNIAPDAPIATAYFDVVGLRGRATSLQSTAESLLSQQRHYVDGSFQYDPHSGRVQFDYRGPESLALKYRLLLSVATGAVLVPVETPRARRAG